MSEPKFEPVTEAELAQLRELHEAARTMRGCEGATAFLDYREFAGALAPRMATHLGALMFTGKAIERAWDADEIGGIPFADLFALCGNVPDGMTLVPTTELFQLVAELKKHGIERICYDCDEPAVDDKACARHGAYVPDGMTLVSATELARLRDVDFELKQAKRDERRMSEHS